jgi:hypothetical protein
MLGLNFLCVQWGSQEDQLHGDDEVTW